MSNLKQRFILNQDEAQVSKLVLLKYEHGVKWFFVNLNLPIEPQIREYLGYFLLINKWIINGKPQIYLRYLTKHNIVICYAKSGESLAMIIGRKGINVKAIKKSFEKIGFKFLLHQREEFDLEDKDVIKHNTKNFLEYVRDEN